MAVKSDDLSPYNYMENNPMNLIDPDCMQPNSGVLGSIPFLNSGGSANGATGNVGGWDIGSSAAGSSAAGSLGSTGNWVGWAVGAVTQGIAANGAFSWHNGTQQNWGNNLSHVQQNQTQMYQQPNTAVGPELASTDHYSIFAANQGGPGPRDTPGITVYFKDGGNSWSYPGLGIHVNIHERNLTGYIQHEYGHYLQYLAHGSSLSWYNKFVAIPSMRSLQQGDSNYVHDRLSFELEATTLAHDFYGKNSVLNNYTFPTFYNFPCLWITTIAPQQIFQM